MKKILNQNNMKKTNPRKILNQNKNMKKQIRGKS